MEIQKRDEYSAIAIDSKSNQTQIETVESDELLQFEYTRLNEWAMARSIEISELRSSTPQDEGNQSLEMRSSDISYIETKITNKKEATEQFAAASPKTALKKEKSLEERLEHSEQLTASPGSKKAQSKQIETENQEETNALRVDYIVNSKWEKLIPELDSAGIPTNKTLKDLLKMYPAEKVRGAIAIFRSRKREQHRPNPSGYFVAALKGDWGGKQIIESPESTGEIDTTAVFRHWYDLARELGYCNSQEIRDGEQWVCLSGSWERWSDTVARGYSLEYLKKIMKRNKRQ